MEAQELTEFLVAQFATFRAEYREDIKTLHNRIDKIESTVNRVEVQTTKTNGRVTALEGHTKSCPVIEVLEEVKQNSKDILEIQASEKVKSSEEYKSGKWLKQAAIVAGYIVGIAALFSGLIYIKDIL